MHFSKRLRQKCNYDIANEITYGKSNLFVTQHMVVRTHDGTESIGREHSWSIRNI
jgi:hypothetical protein